MVSPPRRVPLPSRPRADGRQGSGMSVQAALPERLGWAAGGAPPLDVLGGARKWADGRAVSDPYWSSSSYANNTDNAWNVNFNDGNANNDDVNNDNYVRAVRTGT